MLNLIIHLTYFLDSLNRTKHKVTIRGWHSILSQFKKKPKTITRKHQKNLMLAKLSMLCKYIQSFLVIWLSMMYLEPILMYDVRTYLSGFLNQGKSYHSFLLD